MDAQQNQLLYSEFLLSNDENLLKRLVNLLLDGDLTTYLNLFNYINTDLPVISLKQKNYNYEKIIALLNDAKNSKENPYATAFITKVSYAKDEAHNDEMLSIDRLLGLAKETHPIILVEYGHLFDLPYIIERALTIDKNYAYAHLALGECYTTSLQEINKPIKHYEIATKACLPGAASGLAHLCIISGKYKKAQELLLKPDDEYIREKHATLGLYLEIKAKSIKDYIKAFKHYLIAYALHRSTGESVFTYDISRFTNSQNEHLSKCCTTIFKKLIQLIKNYENGKQNKPVLVNQIFEELQPEFHELKQFINIGDLIKPPEKIPITQYKKIVSDRLNSSRKQRSRLEKEMLEKREKTKEKVRTVLVNESEEVKRFYEIILNALK